MADYIINKDWRITIPAEIRRRKNLKPGDRFEVRIEDGGLKLTPIQSDADGVQANQEPAKEAAPRGTASPGPN